MRSRNSKLQRAGLACLSAVLIAAVAWGAGWALATLTQPVADPTMSDAFTFTSVKRGEVGSTLSLSVVATWTAHPVGINQASGTVTSVAISAGAEASVGDELYSVNLRPASVAQGDIPAFRPLSQNMEGADVAQLQSMLADLGYYGGESDGIARERTDRAIKAWQKDIGVPVTGVVELGDVVFVPQLPARFALDTDVIVRGRTVEGGEEVVRALGGAPDFAIPATASQAAMMPTGTRVAVSGPGGETWEGLTTEHVRDAKSQSVMVGVSGADGGPLCGGECGSVPVLGESKLPSVITTIESVQGLVVPSAALVTGANGSVSVIDDEGVRIEVVVVASARGMSVVDGVDEGLRIRLPGPVPNEGS